MNIEKLAQYILNNKNFLMSEAKEQLIVDMESLKTDEQNGDFEHTHITVEQIDYRFLDINIVFWHVVYEEIPFLRVRYALSNIKTGERVGEYRWEAGWNEQEEAISHWDDFFIIWDRKET